MEIGGAILKGIGEVDETIGHSHESLLFSPVHPLIGERMGKTTKEEMTDRIVIGIIFAIVTFVIFLVAGLLI